MGKKEKKRVDDETIFQLIKEGKSANEIRKTTRIHINTLKNKLLELITKENRIYKVEGINEPKKNVAFTKKGIYIPSAILQKIPFDITEHDEFFVEWDAPHKKIILSKKNNRV